MIDWEITRRKFNISTVDGYRPKVVVRCDKCGKINDLTIRVKSKVIDNNINWICHKCVGSRSEVRSKLSKSTSKKWESQEYKNERILNSKQLWSSPEFIRKHQESVNSLASRKKCSEAAVNAWKNEQYRERHAVALTEQFNKIPSTEVNVIAILDGLGVDYVHQYAVGPYTFDFLIEDYLLIEINGNYWHTRPNVIRKDRAKESYISQINKYKYKVLWESQLSDVDKVISLFKHWIGIEDVKAKSIILKDLEFKLVLEPEYKKFFGCYHYLGGAGRAGTAVGAYLRDELVCCALFAHPTRRETYHRLKLSKNQCLELTRLATSPFYTNSNLCSYSMKMFIKLIYGEYSDLACLIAFSDPIEGHNGTVYKASNWQFDGFTASSYYYVNGDGWKMHKKTLWNKAKGMHLKEKEFADKFGYKMVRTPPLRRFLYYLGKYRA